MSTQNPMYSIAAGVAKGLFGQEVVYCLHEDLFYIYEDGYWRQCFDVELLSAITGHPQVIEAGIQSYPAATKRQILENLKMLVHRPMSAFNREGWLNFPQGMLDVVGSRFLPHSKDYLSTIRLPYSYDPASTAPIWGKTLLEIFDGDQNKVNILQEFFGYCLTRDTRKEKALLLLGESRTGKSTILHILRHMIGLCNVSSVPLKFISNPQYTPMLINKLVNIDSDVSGKAQEFEAEFKIITSGEPVSCNQKFVATFEFMPYCKLVMAANEFPRITDHSSAFYKRLILIPCDRVFEEEEQDITLKDKLTEELPGILNWAVEGLGRLNARGRFEHNQFMTDAIVELREESNPVEIFFRESIEVDFNSEIEKCELYNRYCEWCRINGNTPMANNRFGGALYRKYSKFTPRNTMSHALMKRVWKNLKIKDQTPAGEEIRWQN